MVNALGVNAVDEDLCAGCVCGNGGVQLCVTSPRCSPEVEEPVKESTPAVSMKKQPSVKETAAAVPPVKAAAAEVSGSSQTSGQVPAVSSSLCFS